ncbi:MAG: hypothetical protein IIV61_07820 [Oscillospiraceae bacterium]|nr:hypothetical protein [Oscillospiraceae bacterium]MBQ2384002.1 hypothetical protein [Oscillospiraceae bacterium]MBQ5712500.1 hypothetical protein [Oscillospiraceae bacterium]
MGKKKEKITYIDDGRPLADMSGVRSGFGLGRSGPVRPHRDHKAIWDTYWSAVKMMFVPMLVVIVAMAVIYMIAYFLFTCM